MADDIMLGKQNFKTFYYCKIHVSSKRMLTTACTATSKRDMSLLGISGEWQMILSEVHQISKRFTIVKKIIM